jgi:hypothetical protein
MRKPVMAVAITLSAWIIQDILIWQRLFEARHLWQFDAQYQYWHQAFFLLLIALVASQLRFLWSLWFVSVTWTLANSGLADILYYWFDFKSIPENLPWLDNLHPLILFHPATSRSVVASACLWLIFWIITLIVIQYSQSKRRYMTA